MLYIPFQIFAALILASMINSKLSKLKVFYQTSMFLPYITTPVAIGLIIAILFDWKSGTVNNLLVQWGIMKQGIFWLGEPMTARLVVMFMLFWKYLGYVVILFMTGLTSIPADYYEAAHIDGASSSQRFFKITIPLLNPIILFVIITAISGGLQLFDEIFMLFSGLFAAGSPTTGGPEYSVLTAVWNLYDTAFVSSMRYGYASAIAYGLFIFIITLTAIAYKFSNRGDED
jgi:multiple sugar transport system permease protein/cellobiose transport system permease protein